MARTQIYLYTLTQTRGLFFIKVSPLLVITGFKPAQGEASGFYPAFHSMWSFRKCRRLEIEKMLLGFTLDSFY